MGKTRSALIDAQDNEMKCKAWEDVKWDEPPSQVHQPYMQKDKYPGWVIEVNRNWCRNPGGMWKEPSCFVALLHEVFSCGIPLCPLLQQFRTTYDGEEYGGGMDIRNQSGCVDYCGSRGVALLGPACTIHITPSSDSSSSSSGLGNDYFYSVYYPCPVPLVDGLVVVYRVQLLMHDLPPLVPMTWYLTPSSPVSFPYGAEGRLLLTLPDTGQEITDDSTIINFRMRLADAKDLEGFRFMMVFSPDQTFVDVVTLSFSKSGIVIGHREFVERD